VKPSAPRLLTTACGLLLCLPLRAEVFWRLPRQTDTALQQLGGACVYSTGVQLNGAPGTLSAYSFGSSSSEVRASLSRTLGLQPSASFGGAYLAHTEKGRLHRFFVLPAASGESACVVLAFDQAARDVAQAQREGPAWPDGLPAVVSGPPLFSAVCTQTRTLFAMAETPSDPQQAAQEAAQVLRRAGWSEQAASTPTFKIFSSERKICLLFSSRQPQTERTFISVLQREGAAP
jgi:hypothetical protein